MSNNLHVLLTKKEDKSYLTFSILSTFFYLFTTFTLIGITFVCAKQPKYSDVMWSGFLISGFGSLLPSIFAIGLIKYNTKSLMFYGGFAFGWTLYVIGFGATLLSDVFPRSMWMYLVFGFSLIFSALHLFWDKLKFMH